MANERVSRDSRQYRLVMFGDETIEYSRGCCVRGPPAANAMKFYTDVRPLYAELS